MTSKTETTNINNDTVITRLKRLERRPNIVYTFPGESILTLARATVGDERGWPTRLSRLVGGKPVELRRAVWRQQHRMTNAFVAGPTAVQLALLKRRLELAHVVE